MKLAVTGKNQAGEYAPLVFRGAYADMIAKAKKIGYDAMELHIHDSNTLDRRALKQLFEENRMTLSAIGTGSAYSEDQISLCSENLEKRAKAIKRVQDHIRTASDYGAVVIIGLIKGRICDCSSKEAYLKNLSSSLCECLKTAQEQNVVLVLEVINRYESDFLHTIGEGLAFISSFHSDFLQLHIDTFHMNIEETNIAEAIRSAKGKIGHCHIADSDRWYAGHAHYDFLDTVQALMDIGYEKALSVESFMFPNSEESAQRSLRTLKKCFVNSLVVPYPAARGPKF